MLIHYVGWDLTCEICGIAEHVELRVPRGGEIPRAFDHNGTVCLSRLKLGWQLIIGVLYCGECVQVLVAAMREAAKSIELRGVTLTSREEVEAFYLKNAVGPVVSVRTKDGERVRVGCASEALSLISR